MRDDKVTIWTVTSEQDPRWNGAFRLRNFPTYGESPEDIKAHIAQCVRSLGTAPDDILVHEAKLAPSLITSLRSAWARREIRKMLRPEVR